MELKIEFIVEGGLEIDESAKLSSKGFYAIVDESGVIEAPTFDSQQAAQAYLDSHRAAWEQNGLPLPRGIVDLLERFLARPADAGPKSGNVIAERWLAKYDFPADLKQRLEAALQRDRRHQ